MPYFHKKRHEGYLRHLLVRKAAKTGEILVDLVTSGAFWAAAEAGKDFSAEAVSGEEAEIFGEKAEVVSGEETEAGREWETELLSGMAEGLLKLKLDGRIVGILHTKNDSVADAVVNQGTDILYGQDYFYEELLGLRFRISPFSFFQTNSLGAEVLYETAREYIGDALTEGKDKVVIYLKKERAKKILPPNWNVCVTGELTDRLIGRLGEKNVRVVQKELENLRKMH